MIKFLEYCRVNISYVLLSAFWLFALFNPVFKKYDYGAGWPLVILFGVLLAVIGIFEFRKKREIGSAALWETVFLLIFLGGIVTSFIFSETRNVGFSEVVAFGSMVPLYLVFAHRKNKWMGGFLRVVVFGAILAVILGYILYFFRDEPRMMGPFFNKLYHAHVWPNAFALFLLMVWPVFLLFGKKGVLRALLIGLMFSALLLTYSRGAFVVLGGQCALLLVYFWKRLSLRSVFLMLLTGVVAFALFMGANFVRSLNHEIIDVSERVSFENSESLTSGQERVDFWVGAVALASERPLTGWGPFSFRYAYNGIQKTFLGSADHPHNVFLKIAAENGLVALAGFVGFLIAVLGVCAVRFRGLDKERRDALYVLGVCVAGAFAHNLIDYNLNFLVNLLLLFLFIIFARSLVVKKTVKVRRVGLGMVLGVVVGVICLYEGVILAGSYVLDESLLEHSLFPRNYYLTEVNAEKQLMLNPLDSQAWYLIGDFERALELNPLNDFVYYRDYLRTLFVREEIDNFIAELIPLLNDYFVYVENNVHFTAYTSNVEAAAELIDLVVPYLFYDEAQYFLTRKQEMLDTAERLRGSKTF